MRTVGASHPHPQGNIGPRPHLAQSWTPEPVVTLLWKGMIDCGFHPQRHPVVHDLAAGYGRLVDGVDHLVKLVLNDIDPELTRVLRQRFPGHSVTTRDFRRLDPGTIRCAVGSPPWINDGGDFLPYRYLHLLANHMAPGAIAGLVLPDWFFPDMDRLEPVMTLRPTDAQLGWAAGWKQRPVCAFYRRT